MISEVSFIQRVRPRRRYRGVRPKAEAGPLQLPPQPHRPRLAPSTLPSGGNPQLPRRFVVCDSYFFEADTSDPCAVDSPQFQSISPGEKNAMGDRPPKRPSKSRPTPSPNAVNTSIFVNQSPARGKKSAPKLQNSKTQLLLSQSLGGDQLERKC